MRKGIWIDEKTFLQFAEQKTSLMQEIATREGSINYYSLGMYLPNPDPVLKRQGKDITIYREILSDAHVGGCVTSRKAGVLSLQWSIDRGKAKSRQAKIIESVFRGLDLEHIISEILNAPLFGYQVLEVIWGQVGNYILPVAIVGKPQEWFVFDESNNLKLRTKSNYNGESVPEKKFLLVQHDATYQNPYGTPVLSRCFWPVTFKRGGIKFWVIFSEKYGMPFLIGKHPRGTPQHETDKFADMLAAMVQDAVAVIPDDSSVEIHEAGGKGASAEIYSKLLDYCRAEISIAILGQNLTTEIKGGSYAAAESHMRVRKDIIDADKRLVEKTLNQAIRWIYEINFDGADDIPVFTMWEEEDVDKDLAERDVMLAKTGVQFTKKYFQKNYGLEEEDFEIGVVPLQFAEKVYEGNTELIEGQKQIDSLVDDAVKKSGLDLAPLYKIVNDCTSYTELQQRIAEAYKNIDMSEFQDILARAMFIAELKGRSLSA